jgi:hypothetical protein
MSMGKVRYRKLRKRNPVGERSCGWVDVGVEMASLLLLLVIFYLVETSHIRLRQ